ncbi:MAG: N-acetylmuramoyl-L-alanine amidase [Phycisphaeraceae bacterium]|nr:N-acetylmuramoyl-L-alanine amidase [Phycisphaeraceae bacterium]
MKGNGSTTRMSRRSKTVWLSLLAAMTGVSGALLALEGGPAPRFDGLTLPALAAATGPVSMEVVLAPRQPLDRARWQGIVIEQSGSPFGTAASIDQEHKARNLRGLGYHFVIGNGNGLSDGEIHVGYRWLEQQAGAHTGGPDADWYNQHAIGICLVGNGDRRSFTDAQMSRLVELVGVLARDLGIPPERIVFASDVSPSGGPGRLFPAAAFREQVDARR